ncbi:ATP-dependent nuclease [Pseudoduganella violaceinigra]|uniref:ATP-dependent nuclease n=1 Tax=Pseudoduganella violaceinigra TaxID=246602 RepID=UPI001E43A76E|nr:AAA family ATPase [Pseudoduganella violaceinigra]
MSIAKSDCSDLTKCILFSYTWLFVADEASVNRVCLNYCLRAKYTAMYLSELGISNFRKLKNVQLRFQPGLNVIVGANNVGKSAVVDCLRALLAGHDEPYPRFDLGDLHRPPEGMPEGDIEFHYVFRELEPDDEADFLAAIKQMADGQVEAHIRIRYFDPDLSGRFKVKRWVGDHEDVPLNSDMMENLRGVYLQPLRDASQSLRPSKSSQLARLIHLLADEDGRAGINNALIELDAQLTGHRPIRDTQQAVTTRHREMLGNHLSQAITVGLSASDFQRLSSRLALTVDNFELDQNGLGFNNLICMAVVLSELAKNPEATYRGLIIEEPEAHLHPQLQAILLDYLAGLPAVVGEKPVQLFVTSHSPHFASNANLDSLTCLVDSGDIVTSFFPREVKFDKGKREKLERYLDVTRAELFFARKVIFVEGAAERMLVDVLANKAGHELREHGVSLISVEGLNFDSFLPLFGENALKIPVALITDADPQSQIDEADEENVEPNNEGQVEGEAAQEDDEEVGYDDDEDDIEDADVDGEVPDVIAHGDVNQRQAQPADGGPPAAARKRRKAKAVYPALGDAVIISKNTAKMKAREDRYVRVFYGVKTLEYDLALHENNRDAMLTALADFHPKIARNLRRKVEGEADNRDKAKVLFKGMFERKENNIQKGRFGQSLAQVITDGADCSVPEYIRLAVEHICNWQEQA